MANEHGRYDELALDHVLGGLSGRDASVFRSHLASCEDCRSRVAELRGIADELGAVERDERSRSRIRTEVARRDEDPGPAHDASPTRKLTVGHVAALTVVVLLLAAGVAFWNLHLRTVVGAYESVVDAQSDALSDLASGVLVEADLADGVAGRMALNDDQLAFALTGIDIDDRDVIAVWVTRGTGETELAAVAPGELLRGGTYGGVVDVGDATRVQVTREDGEPGDQPSGDEIARSRLRAQAT